MEFVREYPYTAFMSLMGALVAVYLFANAEFVAGLIAFAMFSGMAFMFERKA